MPLRILTAAAILSFLPLAEAADKRTQLTIEVRNHENEPVDRAAVIVKPMKGNRVRRSYELRTSQQGLAPLPPLDRGTFLVQVIAKGYQTYGGKHEVNEPEHVIRIQLKPPQEQFSVHK
jgi:hypothetical protein